MSQKMMYETKLKHQGKAIDELLKKVNNLEKGMKLTGTMAMIDID